MQNGIICCHRITRCFIDHRCSCTPKASGFVAGLHRLREGKEELSSVMFQKDEECHFCTEGFWKAQLLSDRWALRSLFFVLVFFLIMAKVKCTILQDCCRHMASRQKAMRFYSRAKIFLLLKAEKPLCRQLTKTPRGFPEITRILLKEHSKDNKPSLIPEGECRD